MLANECASSQQVHMPRFNRISRSGCFDVIIVGGGITGLSAAYYLEKMGHTTCILERNAIGGGDTSHPSALLTYVTEKRLTHLTKTIGRDRAKMAWMAGLHGLELIQRIVLDLDIQNQCSLHPIPSYVHASLQGEQDESDELKDEALLARALGFDVDYLEYVPVVAKPGLRFHDQAAFHPAAFIAGLAKYLAEAQCTIFENTEVTSIEPDRVAVVANGVRLECQKVLLTGQMQLPSTGSSRSDTALQKRLTSYATYAISGTDPSGLSIEFNLRDNNELQNYLWIDHHKNAESVISIGAERQEQKGRDEESFLRQLEDTLHRLAPMVEIDRRWSGKMLAASDGLPLIGAVSPHEFVAKGFSGNGITWKVLAGAMASDWTAGRDLIWSKLFDPLRELA